MKKIFIDMDGVIVDFDRYMKDNGMSAEAVKRGQDSYLNMLPMEGAIDAVRALIALDYDVWIASKPPTAVPGAYADKVAWIMHYLPELERKIILTSNKGLLGGEGDYLIDDRPHKAGCEDFEGTLIHFTEDHGWNDIVAFFSE